MGFAFKHLCTAAQVAIREDTETTQKFFKCLLLTTRYYKCEQCIQSVWQGRLIPLQVVYKNGNVKDNHDENLALMCPNCAYMCS